MVSVNGVDFRECRDHRKVRYVVPTTIETSQTVQPGTSKGELGDSITNDNETLERTQIPNVIWELGEHVERYIQVQQALKFSDDLREGMELVIGYVQSIELV